MSKVVISLSMSLDGFITGPGDGPGAGLGKGGERLFDWYFSGTDPHPRYPMFRPQGADRTAMERIFDSMGAALTGRRTYDIANGWGGSHPVGAIPIVLLTHRPPADPPQGRSSLTVITEGLEAAVEAAKRLAGENAVGVSGADVARQCLRAGLVDELWLAVAPTLLGDGVRLFEDLRPPIDLEVLEVLDGPRATHLRYRVRDGGR